MRISRRGPRCAWSSKRPFADPSSSSTTPLPAGLEAVDTSIGKGARARVLPGRGGGWWVTHHEMRGDRIVLFVDHLVAGRHTVALPLRATTPGRYGMPPARAESMYYPEIFGYTPGEAVQVVSR